MILLSAKKCPRNNDVLVSINMGVPCIYQFQIFIQKDLAIDERANANMTGTVCEILL